MRHLNFFRELSAAALLTLGLSVNVSAQTNALPEIPATDATNYMNQQVVVTDIVAQVALRPTVALLNLDKKFPASPLTCVIRGDDTNNFPNIENYLGKRVEVTGRIKDYQGRPEIILTSTNQIKIIVVEQISPKPAPPAVEPQTNAPPVTEPKTNAAASVQPPLTSASPPQPVAKAEEKPDRTGDWIAGSLTVVIVLLALDILFWRRKPGHALTLSSAGVLAESSKNTSSDSLSVQEWKQRALVAEAMAGKQGQMLREKIMPELTEFAKQSLVQGLYAQRNALIETQQKAQQALIELESRLTALQLPLQERIRAYEKRIVELEKEVETQGEEVRELTRATLTLVRKKLEDERQLERAQNRFN
ncbi:MAG TPA: hypothetical protein VGM58_07325 [Verrucomicrobiae bacterium]